MWVLYIQKSCRPVPQVRTVVAERLPRSPFHRRGRWWVNGYTMYVEGGGPKTGAEDSLAHILFHSQHLPVELCQAPTSISRSCPDEHVARTRNVVCLSNTYNRASEARATTRICSEGCNWETLGSLPEEKKSFSHQRRVLQPSPRV